MMYRLRRLLRGTKGQGLAEFVLAIPVFMVLFSGIYEFSRYYTTRLRIRSAVAEGARFGTTGNVLLDEDTGDPLGRAQSIKNTILAHVAQFGVTADHIDIDPADGGAPEEVVTITLDYEYEVAIPLMESVLGTEVMDFTVSTVMRNEPFFQEEA
jgi:hypothetical protein